jgi:AraC family transcriptional activator of pobA
MKQKKNTIPSYKLETFRPVHRQGKASSAFGNNNGDHARKIDGFELFSGEGLIGSVGPLRSEFYRVSITATGTLDMQIGLEHYKHLPRTICFTYPNQVFSKNNISADASGYYLLFKPDFLNELVPMVNFTGEFPFFDPGGIPLFRLTQPELDTIIDLVMKMEVEMSVQRSGRVKAIKMYLYLLLLEAKRSYERQELGLAAGSADHHTLVKRFNRLVAKHYLVKRQVADYAAMLGVSPNHLNRVIKEATAITASDTIKEMLVQEAKALLRYTDSSVSEIAYQLDFSDPASFNRFFKACTAETPSAFRSMHH